MVCRLGGCKQRIMSSENGIHCQQIWLLNCSHCKYSLHSAWRCSGEKPINITWKVPAFSLALINGYVDVYLSKGANDCETELIEE